MNYNVVGPPGTGKTQTLLDKVIEYNNGEFVQTLQTQ